MKVKIFEDKLIKVLSNYLKPLYKVESPTHSDEYNWYNDDGDIIIITSPYTSSLRTNEIQHLMRLLGWSYSKIQPLLPKIVEEITGHKSDYVYPL